MSYLRNRVRALIFLAQVAMALKGLVLLTDDDSDDWYWIARHFASQVVSSSLAMACLFMCISLVCVAGSSIDIEIPSFTMTVMYVTGVISLLPIVGYSLVLLLGTMWPDAVSFVSIALCALIWDVFLWAILYRFNQVMIHPSRNESANPTKTNRPSPLRSLHRYAVAVTCVAIVMVPWLCYRAFAIAAENEPRLDRQRAQARSLNLFYTTLLQQITSVIYIIYLWVWPSAVRDARATADLLKAERSTISRKGTMISALRSTPKLNRSSMRGSTTVLSTTESVHANTTDSRDDGSEPPSMVDNQQRDVRLVSTDTAAEESVSIRAPESVVLNSISSLQLLEQV